MTTKAALNSSGGATTAAAEPIATPTVAGTAQSRITSGITSPRARCAR